ncbi:branched-chain amino acid ABC transporter substrate-binding protein [Herbaspirillum rhizosphaerae]|uniref:Branched-chain amino acid ABC transporter substrate-binding protein n=1 Tax=Herbaspirillum rhizosphaerae TaxID=346179 RepID=A0ABW8Z0P6_9BURK
MLNKRMVSVLLRSLPMLSLLPFSLVCGPAQAAELVVRLGFSSPLSGPQAPAGKDSLNGVQMAIERLNQQGVKVDGKVLRFELLIKDDKANPQTGAVVAKELVDAGVKAVLGPFNSGVALATSKIYNDAGVVSLTVASNPKVTQSALNHVFRIAASDSEMGSKMALYAARNLKLKAVAIVDDGSAYAQGLIEEFQKTVRQNGVQIVYKAAISDKETDFSGVLNNIRAARAEAIFFGGYVSQASGMLKQMQQLGMPTLLLGGDALCSSVMLTQAGTSLGDRTYCVQGGVWLTRVSDGAVFASAYQSKYGSMPDVYAPTFYDGVMLLAQAMKSSNSIDTRNFLPVLARLRYKGITASYEFDAKHDMKESTVTILRFKDGKLAPLSSF